MGEDGRRFWEEIEVGEVHRHGPHRVTEDAIVRFAEQFDPQYFHLSREGGERGPFGKLSASGWHSCSIAMRLMVDGMLTTMVSQGAPGVKSVRWLKPTFVDDELTLVTEIAGKFPSKSRADIGFCHAKHRLEDQDGAAKMVMENNFMIGRRPA
ncbi:MaoC family dehydratase [Minwuia thermotolerans]|uniref:Dehydratase n=1 Tax=Minwuia thermotolerans TaxID=2056226 RepID=A0A2M9G2S8_9PROT|nr:MaoC family dehydratase [Minwuia thermotolerans]PJK29994.1 dehydratase [Minwuia thermotolerans]